MADTAILVIDDEESLRHMLSTLLAKEGFAVTTAASGAEALACAKATRHAVALCDVVLPDVDGLRLIEQLREVDHHLLILVMSAYGSLATAIEAIRRGARDYLSKPFQPQELLLKLRRLIEEERLREENLRLQRELSGRWSFRSIVGKSAAMARLLGQVTQVANHKTTVLITGESGTGKELIARAIHRQSQRRDRAFVAVNCSAIPEALLESELFGHVRGAFTGAVQTKKGQFEAAHRGTLFLDEVGELPQPMQSKLLRVLQERTFRRVGGSEDLSIDFRIVCASKRDLNQEMAEGRFRDDLYYRLNVIQILVPPLRDRREDIPVLAAHFVRKFAGKHGKPIARIDGEAMRALLAYDCPGNVRELENIIERATIMETKNVISLTSLPPSVTKIVITGQVPGGAYQDSLPEEGVFLDAEMDRLEKRYVEKALEKAGGNRTEAAKLLNISLRSIRYRLQKHGIE